MFWVGWIRLGLIFGGLAWFGGWWFGLGGLAWFGGCWFGFDRGFLVVGLIVFCCGLCCGFWLLLWVVIVISFIV